MANKYFHESNRKTKYGEHDVKFWIGTVVAFASQQKQIEEGFGWMYKVRVDGDHAVGADSIKDEQLSYAYCILPTTAGSGGAFKLRSVRISQGDTVFGVRGGGKNAPHFIIGVFPRTRLTKNSSGNFGMLSGFYGSLNKNDTLSGEFNDQIGPATPGVTPLNPKDQNLSNRPDPSENVETIGYDSNDEGIIDNVREKLTPPTTDPSTPWKEGTEITKGQVRFILNGKTNPPSPEYNYTDADIIAAIDQARTQNLFTTGVADTASRKIEAGGDGASVLAILFPPEVPVNPS